MTKLNSTFPFAFDVLVENYHFPIFRCLINSQITFVNKAFCNKYNFDEQQLLGTKWFSNLAGDKKKLLKAELLKSSEEKNSFTFFSEKDFSPDDKNTTWNAFPLLNSDGEFLGEFQFVFESSEKQKQALINEDKNKEQFDFLFNRSLDGIFFLEIAEPIDWDNKSTRDVMLRKFYHEMRVVKVNQEFLKQYGFLESHAIGLSPADFFVHNYAHGLELCKQILENENILLISDERNASNEQIIIEAQYSVVKNKEGFITGLFGIQKDITKKTKLETDLRNSETLYKASFENNALPIIIYDLDTLIVQDVNQAAINTYGYTKDEFLKLNLKDLRPKEEVEKFEANIKRIKENLPIPPIQPWKHKTKDGTILNVEIRAQNIFFRNKKSRIVTINNVTEKEKFLEILKNSEESYIELFNSVSDAIYLQDENGIFIDVNTGAEKMYGYSREEFISRSPEFLSAPGKNDLAAVKKNLDLTIAGYGPITFEFWGLKKNGIVFPKDVTINKGKYLGKDIIIAIARDISDRKEIETNLSQSEKNFRKLFNDIHDAILIHDFEGNILEANEKALRLYDLTRIQMLQSKTKDLSADINMQLFRILKINEKVKNGESLVFEWKAKQPLSGKTFDVEISLTNNLWYEKATIFAVIRDITEKKKVERALHDREESYRGLFNSIDDAILILNFDGNLIDLNRYAENLVGFSKDEILSKSLLFISDKEKNNLQSILENISHTFYTGKTFSFDYWMKHKNGFSFPVEIKLTRDKYNDRFAVIAVARDITERINQANQLRESEERLRDLYENASVGIFRTTPDGKVLFANPALVNMLGYATEQEFKLFDIGNTFYKNKTQREFITKSLEKYGRIIGAEFELKKKDGSLIIVRENSRVIREKNGEVLYYEGTIENITSKKIAESALIDSEKTLRELNATKDKFFSIIAHDLRSPFQGLLGLASILSEENVLDETERSFYTKKLYEGLKNQFNLLDDLLTWSRVQRGAIDFNPAKGILKNDFEEVLLVLYDLASKKNITIKTNMEEDLFAIYDKNMISLVFRNVLSNAIKFTPNYGTISIEAHNASDDIVVSVTDSGIGISQDDIKKLFSLDTPFSRKGTNQESGTGLGLILCKEFINKHNGKIWIESEIDKGSTFSFSLPKNLKVDEEKAGNK